MKKEDITGLIVYVFILVFAVIFGLTVLQNHTSDSLIYHTGDTIGYMAFMLGAIVFGVALNSTIYELGHVAGAKTGGYDVQSVNILGFNWYKNDGKWAFKFSSFDGLSGETKIFPKDDFKNKKGENTEPSPYGYLWFGTLFIALEVIVVMILFVTFTNSDKTTLLADFGYFLLTEAMIGLMIMIYNILPFRLDTMTDGYRSTLVSNPKNRVAFNELLRAQKAMENGEEIEIKTFTEITNFTADLNLNKVYQLLDKKNFEEAEKLIDMIIDAKNNISENVYIRARAQKIYINLMNNSVENAQKFYDEQVPVSERRDIADDISMPSIRAYLLMAGILDKSRSECIIALNNVYKAYKKTPKARQNIEMSLFNETLSKVIEAHPKWELEGYLLKAKEESKKEK